MAQILLVDDEKVARALYSDFLTGAGHSVTPVGSLGDAKTALSTQTFELLVTDLILPEGDGIELLQYSKAKHPDVEVIVITALDKVEPAVRAIKGGASDYLVKPVTPEALAHAVNRALTQHSLLRENEALRHHVELLEAGERIATTLDREKLTEIVGAAFSLHCGSSGCALFIREGHHLQFHGTFGLQGEREALDQQLTPIVQASAAEREHKAHATTIDGWPFAYLVPIVENEVTIGLVLLRLNEDAPERMLASANFLARHVALALKTLGRFAEVEDLVYLDDLTHLFNRRYLELVLAKTFKATTPESKPFTLLFLDLDYFKSINDAHGHVTGSKLLVEVGRVLKGCVRDNDVVSRWGGDEYVILLRATDSGGALKVAERIRRSIEHHRFLAREGFSLSITTCIGVASYPEHAADQTTLLDFADRAMYRGKKSSRNIIYLASKGLEATPPARQRSSKLPPLPIKTTTPEPEPLTDPMAQAPIPNDE